MFPLTPGIFLKGKQRELDFLVYVGLGSLFPRDKTKNQALFPIALILDQIDTTIILIRQTSQIDF